MSGNSTSSRLREHWLRLFGAMKSGEPLSNRTWELPVQVVHPAERSFPLDFSDLRGIPESEREGEAMKIAGELARSPFDLQQLPLLRAHLTRIDDGDYRLFLTFHQLIFDGVTAYQVFLPELDSNLQRLRSQSTIATP